MNSWLLNAVYLSQFGCCNPHWYIAILPDKSRYQLCHFSMNVIWSLLRWQPSLCHFVPFSEKWHNWYLLSWLILRKWPYLRIASNIQIGWNKWHAKAIHVTISFYFQTSATFLCTIFSRTPCRATIKLSNTFNVDLKPFSWYFERCTILVLHHPTWSWSFYNSGFLTKWILMSTESVKLPVVPFFYLCNSQT